MIKKRIIEYLDLKGITKYRFYKDTGLSNGFLDKEGHIGSDKCEKISYVYSDLSLDWLITGSGEMLKSEKSYPQDNSIITLPKGEINWEAEYRNLEQKYVRAIERLNELLEDKSEHISHKA